MSRSSRSNASVWTAIILASTSASSLRYSACAASRSRQACSYSRPQPSGTPFDGNPARTKRSYSLRQSSPSCCMSKLKSGLPDSVPAAPSWEPAPPACACLSFSRCSSIQACAQFSLVSCPCPIASGPVGLCCTAKFSPLEYLRMQRRASDICRSMRTRALSGPKGSSRAIPSTAAAARTVLRLDLALSHEQRTRHQEIRQSPAL